jgi:hypothetical protein
MGSQYVVMTEAVESLISQVKFKKFNTKTKFNKPKGILCKGKYFISIGSK